MNKKLKSLIRRTISSLIIFVTFIYITLFIIFSRNSFYIDVIDSKLKLFGPNNEVMNIINQKFLSLLKFDLGTTYNNKQLGELIIPYVIKSLELLILGVLFGFVLGVLKGIIDSRRNGKDTSLKLLFSIIPLSLPDILMIALLQYFAVWLGRHGIKVLTVAGTGDFRNLILPIIALALPCACYIARITAISIEECYKCDYVKIALGKGCSSNRILWNHVMRNAVGMIVEGLSNINAMVICNLVIIEYLFSYPGLTKLLINMNKNRDYSSFATIIVVVGIIYFSLDILFHSFKLLINRQQREETV